MIFPANNKSMMAKFFSCMGAELPFTLLLYEDDGMSKEGVKELNL